MLPLFVLHYAVLYCIVVHCYSHTRYSSRSRGSAAAAPAATAAPTAAANVTTTVQAQALQPLRPLQQQSHHPQPLQPQALQLHPVYNRNRCNRRSYNCSRFITATSTIAGAAGAPATLAVVVTATAVGATADRRHPRLVYPEHNNFGAY